MQSDMSGAKPVSDAEAWNTLHNVSFPAANTTGGDYEPQQAPDRLMGELPDEYAARQQRIAGSPPPHGSSMDNSSFGGMNYRCARGGCGDAIGHPVNQDAHNQSKHLGMATQYNQEQDRRANAPTEALWEQAGDDES